jgi:hypothetical protein
VCSILARAVLFHSYGCLLPLLLLLQMRAMALLALCSTSHHP